MSPFAEPILRLPWGPFLLLWGASSAGLQLLVGGAAALAAQGAQWRSSAGLGVLVASASALCGLLALSPGKTRAIGDWQVRWIAATVCRMLAAIVGAALLYSSPPSVEAFLLALAAAHLILLVAEAALLAKWVSGPIPPPT